MKVSLKSSFAFCLLYFLVSSAWAQEVDTPCGDFQLYPNYLEVDSTKAEEDDVSYGDTRFVHISLVDEEDNEVAQFIHTAVVVPGGSEDRYNLLLEGHMLFRNGTIGVSGIYDRPNLTSDKPEAAPEFNLALHAGTKGFSGYIGEVRLVRDSEDKRVYLFNLPCN